MSPGRWAAPGGGGSAQQSRMVIRALTGADAAWYLAIRREMLADSPWAFASSPDDDRFRDAGVVEAFVAGERQAILGAFADESDPPSLRGDAGAAGPLLGVAGLLGNHRVKMRHRVTVWGMYVTPRARGRGIGEAVLGAAMRLAGAWAGVTSVGLSASGRSAGAIRLYERLGFRRWGVEPGAVVLDGESIDEVHLVAELRAQGPGGEQGWGRRPF